MFSVLWVLFFTLIAARTAIWPGHPMSIGEAAVWVGVAVVLGFFGFTAERKQSRGLADFQKDHEKNITELKVQLAAAQGEDRGRSGLLAAMSGKILETLSERADEIKDPLLRENVQELRVLRQSATFIPTIAIQEPRGVKVPRYKIVRGVVHPEAPLVQVFVRAGWITDKWWFRQGERAAPINGFEWECPSIFGDGKNPNGYVFDICAIIPKKLITEVKIKELPIDAVKSEVVAVTLDYGLHDDWLPSE